MVGSIAVALHSSVLGAIPGAAIPAAWSIGEFLNNARGTAQGWAGLAMMLVGAVAIAFGGIKILIGLMKKDNGGQPIQWVPLIFCIVLGGAFLMGGWSFAASVADSANQTIATLGGEDGTDEAETGNTYEFGSSIVFIDE